MFASDEYQPIATLLRISDSIDIVGDVSVTVANPAELLAWAQTLMSPSIFAWRGHVSGKRYVHVTAVNGANPVHGRITAALRADDHMDYWKVLVPDGDLPPGGEESLTEQELADAWSALPIEIDLAD